jgi:DNA-binding HxlR family transcriptional regulator
MLSWSLAPSMTTSCTECRSPVEHALHAIAGKWKPRILWELLEGTRRFAELQRAIPEVSAKVLTEQLRELEADALLERQVFAEVPPRVEYTLTALGRALDSVLAALCDWGRDYESRASRSPGPED